MSQQRPSHPPEPVVDLSASRSAWRLVPAERSEDRISLQMAKANLGFALFGQGRQRVPTGAAALGVGDGLADLAQGLADGDVVAVALPNCPQAFVVFYACMRIGAVAAPAADRFGKARAQQPGGAGAAMQVAGQLAAALPLVDVGQNFAFREGAHRLSQLFALGRGPKVHSRLSGMSR